MVEKHDSFNKLTAEIEELKQQIDLINSKLQTATVFDQSDIDDVDNIRNTHELRD